ncbi:MAG: cytochrome c3 family protein [Deltaproteobacteria bacterium]|nr:cytochrome c3 family protein [Deltaproteobacteria bacterium]
MTIAGVASIAVLAATALWPRPEEPASPPPIKLVPRPPLPVVLAEPSPVPAPGENVHTGTDEPRRCLGCHATQHGPELRAPTVGETCERCHAKARQSHTHPIGVEVPASLAVSLSLGSGRRIDCNTCHPWHARADLIPRGAPQIVLCGGCHPGH